MPPTLAEFLADCRDWLAADTHLTPDEREQVAADIADITVEARQLREREAPDAPLAIPKPPTLLGMLVSAVAGMPPGEVWCVGPGNPPRILGKIVNIGTEAPDAPPDEVL